jgi:hypothetical protein
MVVFNSYVSLPGRKWWMFQHVPAMFGCQRLNHAAPLRLAAALGTPWGSVGELLDLLEP